MNKAFKTVILSFATSALIATGAISSPAQAAPGDQATVTVSKTSALNPDGETITITGTGFVPNGSLTNGSRPPLAGTFSGFYVSFGKFQDVWKPSASAPSGNRKSVQSDPTRTSWLVPAANLATIGGAAGGGVELATDGTFTITLRVSKTLLNSSQTLIFDESTIGNYGIYTYGASGANYAPFETFTPLSFAANLVPVTSAPAAGTTTAVKALETKISKQVTFASGNKKISNSAKRELKKEIANYKIAAKVTITATAAMTTGASNEVVKNLAKQRANSIKKYLVAQGVESEKIVIKTKIAKPGKKPSTKVVATP
ncbi:MAG: OmpA family protein [Actinobacteria bacterium]|nr:OmpA family protein [Actinomycetota bacterium]